MDCWKPGQRRLNGLNALLSDVLASDLLSQETFDYSCCLERKLYI